MVERTMSGRWIKMGFKNLNMKNSVLVVSFLLLALSMGCQKNDAGAPMVIAVKSKWRLSLDLLEVPNGATGVKLNPTLSWEPLEHPNGDPVTYDLYVGTNPNTPALYESDIEGTVVEVGNTLQLITKYYWKVIAKDGKGMRIESKLGKFTTRMLNCPSDPIIASTDFAPRVNHTSVVFENKIWMIGGFLKGYIFKNDVWFSSDGSNWELATPFADFSGRRGHTSVVFDDKIWVIAGQSDGEVKNDVWFTSDGVNWELATADAGFPVTYRHTSVVFDDKIWVIGGFLTDDVWYSSDGVNWVLANGSAPFSVRRGHTSVVFDDKIWLVGGRTNGGDKNDVWYSCDGMQWEQATASADFLPREGHSSIVLDSKIWIMGGSGDGENDAWFINDLWYSSDGTNWEPGKTDVDFLIRFNHTSSLFQNKLWLIAGHTEFGYDNDVWAMD